MVTAADVAPLNGPCIGLCHYCVKCLANLFM